MRHWLASPRFASFAPRYWRGLMRSIQFQYRPAKQQLVPPGQCQPSVASRSRSPESVPDTRSWTSSPYTADTLRVGNEHLLHQIPQSGWDRWKCMIGKWLAENTSGRKGLKLSTRTSRNYAVAGGDVISALRFRDEAMSAGRLF